MEALDIIIIDDEHDIRGLLKDYLEFGKDTGKFNYHEIIEFGNPNDAIAYIKEKKEGNRLYLVDLDLKNNDLNGFGIAEKINEVDKMAKFYIVSSQTPDSYITGNKDDWNNIKNYSGYLGYITKPIALGDFVKEISSALKSYKK